MNEVRKAAVAASSGGPIQKVTQSNKCNTHSILINIESAIQVIRDQQ